MRLIRAPVTFLPSSISCEIRLVIIVQMNDERASLGQRRYNARGQQRGFARTGLPTDDHQPQLPDLK